MRTSTAQPCRRPRPHAQPHDQLPKKHSLPQLTRCQLTVVRVRCLVAVPCCTGFTTPGRLPVEKPCLWVGVSAGAGRLGLVGACSSCLLGAATAAAPLTAGRDCLGRAPEVVLLCCTA